MRTVPKIYGLIGWPLAHSLSPAMHNAAFKALGVEAEYKLFPLKAEDLEPFLSSLDKSGIAGLNVTVPYKEKALGFVKLDKESFFLRQIGAINTMVLRNGSWWGFNTDIPGFSQHLKEQFEPAGKKAAIIGAGGACRAVAYVLAQETVSEIAIFDIDTQKSAGLITMIKYIFPQCNIYAVDSIIGLDIKGKDLLVNATPVGLKSTDPGLVEASALHKSLFVYDLIYNPAQTNLLRLAKKAGARTSNGLGMLLYQGMLSFKLWTGQEAPQEVMRRALETAENP